MLRTATLFAAFTAALALSLPAAAQSASDFPTRKPGYWEIKMATEKPAGAPAIDTQVCLDAATDKELMEFELRTPKESCARFERKNVGRTVVIESDCKFGPVRSATRMTMTGDFQTSYTVRIEGTAEGLPLPGSGKGAQEVLMVQTARWTAAACPAGMKPGDFTLPGGLKFNIQQARQLKKILPQILIR